MSGASPTLAQQFSLYLVFQDIGCALTALVAYEYVITFDLEVALVWRKKFTATSVLLLSVRWVMVLDEIIAWAGGFTPRVVFYSLLHLIIILMSRFATKSKGCKPINIVHSIITLINFTQMGLFSALRVFSIGKRNIRSPWFISTLALGIIPVAIGILGVIDTGYVYVGPPFSGCETYSTQSPKLLKISAYTGSLAFILSDFAALLATWIMTFKHWNSVRQLGLPVSVSTLLLRDGSTYFGALLVVNLLQIIFMDSTIPYIQPFLITVPAIIMNRFFLNLRSFGDTSNDPTSGWNEQGQSRSLRFQPRAQTDIMGNIGASLQLDSDDVGSTMQWDDGVEEPLSRGTENSKEEIDAERCILSAV